MHTAALTHEIPFSVGSRLPASAIASFAHLDPLHTSATTPDGAFNAFAQYPPTAWHSPDTHDTAWNGPRRVRGNWTVHEAPFQRAANVDPPASHDVRDVHDTLYRALFLPTEGTGSSDHEAPFQVMLIGAPLVSTVLLSYPAAMQNRDDSHEMLVSQLFFSADESGVVMSDQLVPFHTSARVTVPVGVVEFPTATQDAALAQDTPWKEEPK
jgi:hypothetical protein